MSAHRGYFVTPIGGFSTSYTVNSLIRLIRKEVSL